MTKALTGHLQRRREAMPDGRALPLLPLICLWGETSGSGLTRSARTPFAVFHLLSVMLDGLTNEFLHRRKSRNQRAQVLKIIFQQTNGDRFPERPRRWRGTRTFPRFDLGGQGKDTPFRTGKMMNWHVLPTRPILGGTLRHTQVRSDLLPAFQFHFHSILSLRAGGHLTSQQKEEDRQGTENNPVSPSDLEESRYATDYHEEQQHKDVPSAAIEGIQKRPGGSA